MDALEPSQAMMALAAAKKIYSRHIRDHLNSRKTSIENGVYGRFLANS